MSLAKRVIPTLLCRGRQLIKGQQFNGWRSCGLALQAARIHAMRGVDELVLLDIGATPEGREPDLKLVEELAAEMHTPLAVGGGIRTVDDVRALLRAGADKVVIKSAYWHLPEFSRKFGSQAIIAAVDYKNGRQDQALRYAMAMEQAGAGEIMLTSIDSEGTMTGYDLPMIAEVSDSVSIPVIAHGGCGKYHDMFQAIEAGADAVAAGAMFQFTDQTPAGAARYLHAAGIEVRIPNEEASCEH